jgi:hypothetical protein
MSALPVIAAVAGIATIGGAIISSVGRYQQGQAEQAADYSQAQDYESIGRQEFAAAQRDALEAKVQGQLVESRQQAVAAASGGGAGADAPSVIRLMTETGARTQYAADSAMYRGLATRDRYYTAASEKRISGDTSLLGGEYGAIGSLLGGFGEFAGNMK